MERLTEKPTFETGIASSERIIKVQFGDGYQQRARDGINTNLRRWEVRFDNVTTAKAARIVEFFSARGSVEAFQWTPPAPYDNADVFTAPSGLEHRFLKHNNHSLSVILEKDFNPALRCAPVVISSIPDPEDPARMILSMSCATAGAEIRYTMGAAEVPEKPAFDTGRIWAADISEPYSYVRAIAWKSGYLDSVVTDYDARIVIGDGDVRVTEDGNTRTTEDGNTRIVEEVTDDTTTRITDDGFIRTTEDGTQRTVE